MKLQDLAVYLLFVLAFVVIGLVFAMYEATKNDLKELQVAYLESLNELGKYELMMDRELTVTAYTASRNECDSTPNVTAIMEKPVAGWTVAVSRDLVWMLGKKVYIEGLGVRLVQDLMNERFTERLDVLMPDKKSAKKFGKKKLNVVVLG